MTQSHLPAGEEPKKDLRKWLIRSNPVAEVGTLVGHIYLYPLRVRDVTYLGKLKPADADIQVRNLLTSVVSLTLESDEVPDRISLDTEIAESLSDDEIGQLCEAFVYSSEWQAIREFIRIEVWQVSKAQQSCTSFI